MTMLRLCSPARLADIVLSVCSRTQGAFLLNIAGSGQYHHHHQCLLPVTLPLHVSRHASARVIQCLCNLALVDGCKCDLKFGGVQRTRDERRAREEPRCAECVCVWITV